MTKKPAVDLANIENIDSLVRQIIEKKPIENINNFDLDTYSIPPNHSLYQINIIGLDYKKELADAIKSIVDDATKNNIPQTIKFALYEAVLNAYQHGNKKNPHKKIIVSANLTDPSAQFSVTDEGTEIKTSFLSYILWKRQQLGDQYTNFYEFSEEEKPAENHGIGTSLIHTYTDEVNYYKSSTGGLTILMTKRKNPS